MDEVRKIQNVKEYSTVTSALIDRISMLKKQVSSSMMIGGEDIIKGINLFDEIFREINPQYLDDDMVLFIESRINSSFIDFEERRQVCNKYMNYGINCCYAILEGYCNRIKTESHNGYPIRKLVNDDY